MTDRDAPAVRLSGITKRFGDVVANDGVDFRVDRGSVHALVGENGAGKTTLMSVLHGRYRPDEGRVHVDGVERSFDSTRDAIDAGVGMIHQHFKLVDTMTVLQNVVLGHEPTSGGLVDADAARADVAALCDTYGFDVDDHVDERVEDLGVGVQQRVEIVKSLYRGSEVLILDEPTAVLTPQEVEALFDVLAELADRGHALVFITHKLDEAMAAADRITVLRDGRVVGTVDADATDRQELARMMVGRDVLFDVDARETTPGERVLAVEGLRVAGDRGPDRVAGVDLTVRRGEVLGVAGVEGNGQAELAGAITGLRRPDGGVVRFDGDDVTDWSRRRRIEAGIAYVPEDRQSEGLVMTYDLVDNALLGNQTIPPFASGPFVDWDAVRDHAAAVVEAYDVQPDRVDATAASLSGGNQQKFVVGRELERDPDLVVAAQPTRGVDVGAIEFLHERLLAMRDSGVGVLLVSSKLEEVRSLADRIAVMYEGRFVDVVDPANVTDEDLGLLMAGRRPEADGADEGDGVDEPPDAEPATDGGGGEP